MTPFFALLLLIASPDATDTTATPEPKPVKVKKICKSVDLTGSRVGKRECKTKEQWEQGESVMELGQKGAQGSVSR